MSEVVKRGRGRPAKTSPSDPIAIAKKIKEQQLKFGAKCADNLDDLMQVMYDIALDKKKASITNRVSAAKWCIEYAETFLKDDKNKGQIEPPVDPEDEEDDAPLISLVSSN